MTVEPIRDMNKIKAMQHCLKGNDEKYYVLFNLGLNSGLRISDMLPLKKSDLFTEKDFFREYLVLHEKKTKKEKKIKLNDSIRKILNSYCKNMDHKAYLFPSTKGDHISRIQAYRVLTDAADLVGVENFGTHSMRKTWGYWTYKISKYNIGLIMDTFNHSSPSITLRYIGISQEQKDELYSLVQF
jgi:integrase